MRHRARKILEGALYVLMLGADLVPVFFDLGISGLIFGLRNFWLGVLGLALLVSIIGAIAGPWRVRGHLALWYACIAVWFAATASFPYGVRQEQPIINDILTGVGLIGLLGACILPVVWLITLPRAEPWNAALTTSAP